ncbi:TIGR02221 family CRISPR-associated protein [Bacteroides sp. OttesenSCG-928-E20]|nr:TIGR02221 family CRISPR-associated protein [Bacteroides sp. OttesenSCG-928-N06]MDL2299158.1 TIGR02221 family CRISPR-associated protein [Bacteroides sp. OttesenSCG-928-E20]MDL2304645.1 TIGR02221 family CRISPR-associated protein [Bacteroides sp. OttesenSCG-928-D19]
MARKVFVSVLGTGFYEKCRYVKDEFKSTETSFIQQATLEYLNAKEWESSDIALILLTQKAKKFNWNKTIAEKKYPRTKELMPYVGLEKILEDINLPIFSKPIDIPDGKDEEEMWKIFTILFEELQDGDELYFELTHSFRYLPMLVLVLGNYSKFLKGITIKHISYGNYEARNEKEEAPIIDLLPLSALQDWTFAAANYLENGHVDRLVNLSNDSLRLLSKDEKTRTVDTQNLRSFIKYLKLVVDERQTCRGIDIIESKNLKKLKKIANQLDKVVLEPFKPVFEKIRTSLDEFDEEENVKNGFASAKWCFDNNLYQSAATILQESVVTFFCVRHGIAKADEERRGIVNSAFFVKEHSTPEEKWNIKECDRELFKDVLNDILLEEKTLINLFLNLTTVRNDFNHSGMRLKQTPLSPKALKDNIEKCLNGFTQLLYP